jgi:hypothetical protein
MDSLALMLPALDRRERGSVCQVALHMADGRYRHSEVESPDTDPLSNVYMPRDTVGMLQAAALRTLGAAEEAVPGHAEDNLEALVDRALTAVSPKVRAAALDVLSRIPRLSASVDLDSALGDPNAEVRYYAIRAARARQPTLLERHRTQLAKDSSELSATRW